jgi:23S rRNA pseudouridine1911/1915/1917 synthase
MAVLATGRPALTHAETVVQFDVCDLVRISLATGRTHQIRVHLHHIGHPIVGDPVYAGGGHKRVAGSQQARARAIEKLTPRQALHAACLSFRHPQTGDTRVFRAEWPADLKAALDALYPATDLLARDNPLDYLGFFR